MTEADMRKRLREMQGRIEDIQEISRKETELKNLAFTFIIKKGIYTEYHEWVREKMLRKLVSSL